LEIDAVEDKEATCWQRLIWVHFKQRLTWVHFKQSLTSAPEWFWGGTFIIGLGAYLVCVLYSAFSKKGLWNQLGSIAVWVFTSGVCSCSWPCCAKKEKPDFHVIPVIAQRILERLLKIEGFERSGIPENLASNLVDNGFGSLEDLKDLTDQVMREDLHLNLCERLKLKRIIQGSDEQPKQAGINIHAPNSQVVSHSTVNGGMHMKKNNVTIEDGEEESF